MTLSLRSTLTSASACLFILLIVLYFPIRTLVADYYYSRVEYVLDDKATDELDVKPVSSDTMPDYISAIKYLKKAVAIDPSRSLYLKALSDVYSKLGRWAVNMKYMKASLPSDAINANEAFENSFIYLKKAIALDPMNPDHHLALGKLYDEKNNDALLSEQEFKRALLAYPVSAPLRYAIARHYLLTKRKGDALEQARILAKIDDSYILPESIQKKITLERRPPEYLTYLSNSYLFKALEITWRISNDPEVIKGIAPDNIEAKEVVQLFFEWKGIEE